MPATGPRPDPRSLTEVADGVHVATARRWTTTSTVVVAPDGGCLVIDPALTVDELDGLAAAVDARGWRVEAGAATHPHWDHVLWSTALGSVPRWATPTTAAIADGGQAARLAAAEGAPGHDAAVLAVLTPLDRAEAGTADGAVGTWTLPWSGRAVLVVEHASHAPGAAALVVPDAGVLVAGDLLSDLEVPYVDLGSPDPVGDLLRALDLLERTARAHDVTVLVPGHGHVTDAAGLAHRLAVDRRYLEVLAGGGEPDDARLQDDGVRREHERQVAHLRSVRAGAVES